MRTSRTRSARPRCARPRAGELEPRDPLRARALRAAGARAARARDGPAPLLVDQQRDRAGARRHPARGGARGLGASPHRRPGHSAADLRGLPSRSEHGHARHEQYFFHGVDASSARGSAASRDRVRHAGLRVRTCSEKDRQMARRVEAIAGVEAAALGRDLMAARGDVEALSTTVLVRKRTSWSTIWRAAGSLRSDRGVRRGTDPGAASELLASSASCATSRCLMRCSSWSPTLAGRAAASGCGRSADLAERALGRPLGDDGAWVEGWHCRERSRWCRRWNRPSSAQRPGRATRWHEATDSRVVRLLVRLAARRAPAKRSSALTRGQQAQDRKRGGRRLGNGRNREARQLAAADHTAGREQVHTVLVEAVRARAVFVGSPSLVKMGLVEKALKSAWKDTAPPPSGGNRPGAKMLMSMAFALVKVMSIALAAAKSAGPSSATS